MGEAQCWALTGLPSQEKKKRGADVLSEPDPSSSISWNQHWEATGFPSAAVHASSDRGQFKIRVSEGWKSMDWCLGFLLARRGVEEVAACPPAGLAVGLSSVTNCLDPLCTDTALVCRGAGVPHAWNLGSAWRCVGSSMKNCQSSLCKGSVPSHR